MFRFPIGGYNFRSFDLAICPLELLVDQILYLCNVTRDRSIGEGAMIFVNRGLPLLTNRHAVSLGIKIGDTPKIQQPSDEHPATNV